MVVFNWYGFALAILAFGAMLVMMPIAAAVDAREPVYASMLHLSTLAASMIALTFDRYQSDATLRIRNRLVRAMLPYYADAMRQFSMTESRAQRIAFIGLPVAIWPQVVVIVLPGFWAYWTFFGESDWTPTDWLLTIAASVAVCILSLAYALLTVQLREVI